MMEENNEKKKNPRRRHYRGRNNDRQREGKPGEEIRKDRPDKAEKAEKTEKPEKPERRSGRGRAGNQDRSESGSRRDKGERPDKGERQEKGRKREDRRPPKKEITVDAAPEEKIERTKREPEETIFDFTWADAWGLYGVGYHIVIKDNQERMYLSWSVDLIYGEMKIGQRLKEFLEDMKRVGLNSWDGRRYTKSGIFDGDTWSLKINSLSLKCEAQGTNEYPGEWKDFLKCLHEKWGIPVSRREQWE